MLGGNEFINLAPKCGSLPPLIQIQNLETKVNVITSPLPYSPYLSLSPVHLLPMLLSNLSSSSPVTPPSVLATNVFLLNTMVAFLKSDHGRKQKTLWTKLLMIIKKLYRVVDEETNEDYWDAQTLPNTSKREMFYRSLERTGAEWLLWVVVSESQGISWNVLGGEEYSSLSPLSLLSSARWCLLTKNLKWKPNSEWCYP